MFLATKRTWLLTSFPTRLNIAGLKMAIMVLNHAKKRGLPSQIILPKPPMLPQNLSNNMHKFLLPVVAGSADILVYQKRTVRIIPEAGYGTIHYSNLLQTV